MSKSVKSIFCICLNDTVYPAGYVSQYKFWANLRQKVIILTDILSISGLLNPRYPAAKCRIMLLGIPLDSGSHTWHQVDLYTFWPGSYNIEVNPNRVAVLTLLYIIYVQLHLFPDILVYSPRWLYPAPLFIFIKRWQVHSSPNIVHMKTTLLFWCA